MSNLADALKQEIARIARKEIREHTSATKKGVTHHRRDIADLKRQVAALKREVSFLRSQEQKRVTRRPPVEAAEGKRFSPAWLQKHRQKVGMSAADYALLVGVHPITIYSWEQGKTKPRKEQLAALATVRKLGKRDAQKRLEMVA